jgi:hypothetical protein
MITEVVLGQLRQVFEFKRGKFYAPLAIGAGYRAQIDSAKAMAALNGNRAQEQIAEYFKENPAPKGIPFEGWYKTKIEELYPILVSNFDLKEAWRGKLVILECVLTPAQTYIDKESGQVLPCPSVEQWYREFSEESEVDAVVNFIEGTPIGKIETEHTSRPTGEGLKTEEKAGRSKGTSRPRSAR